MDFPDCDMPLWTCFSRAVDVHGKRAARAPLCLHLTLHCRRLAGGHRHRQRVGLSFRWSPRMVWVLVGAHTHTHTKNRRAKAHGERASQQQARSTHTPTHTHRHHTVVAPHPTPRAPRARHSPPHPPHHPFLHAMSSSSSTGHLRAARPTGAVAPTARAPRRSPLPVLHRAPPWHSRRCVVNFIVSSAHLPPAFPLSPRFIQRSSRSISAFPRLPIVKTYHVIRFTAHTPVRGTPHPGTRQAPVAFPPTFHRTSTPLSRRHTTPLVRRSTRHHTVTCIRTGEGRPHHAASLRRRLHNSLRALRHRVLRQLRRQQQAHRRLNLGASQASDGRSHVQATQPRSPDDQTYR